MLREGGKLTRRRKHMQTQKRKGIDRSNTIYLALRQAIIEQALEPGAKLPEDAIGERFGVSRTIVRHALGRLASEGLAELRPNRGASVAKPSWAEARDIYEIRMTVERMVMQRLAGNLSKIQITRLGTHVDQEEMARGGDERRSIRLATEFHIMLAEMTASDTLTQYVTQLASRCGLILALYSRPHSSECAVSEHRDVIEALVQGDHAKATEVMDHHLHAVIGRALAAGEPSEPRDIRDILTPYVQAESGLEVGDVKTSAKERTSVSVFPDRREVPRSKSL
jgi:DNA-binding GntR family transcriptional regulator